jgi:hypothetical protein
MVVFDRISLFVGHTEPLVGRWIHEVNCDLAKFAVKLLVVNEYAIEY